MPAARSSEIESVARRVLKAWGAADEAAMINLFSPDANLRVLGFDQEEWWVGPASFHKVWQAQMAEMPDWKIEIEGAEAFEDGPIGWATMFTTLITPETQTAMRHTGVFRLEAGVWRAIQWHNSIPVSNQQIFGVALTTTLDDLVNSILDDSSSLKAAAGLEGTITLVFTDIVDSTGLAQRVGDGAWADAIGKHEKEVERITAEAGGTVIKFLGDGSMLAFDSARAAVRASVAIQRAMSGQFALRVGIHTGEVIRTDNDLYGVTVNKAARVAASAAPGEIMVSSTTKDLIGPMDGIRLGESRLVALKGLPDTHQIVPVEWD